MSETGGMITHYGIFWRLADVQWTRKGSGLLGKVPSGTKGKPSNAHRDYSKYSGVYCLYHDSRLIYVGEAGLGNDAKLFNRLRVHLGDDLAGRWDEFSWFGRSLADGDSAKAATGLDPKIAKGNDCFSSDCLAQLEAVLVAAVNPGSNKQGGAFKRAMRVEQHVSKGATGDVSTQIDRLRVEILKIQALVTPAPVPKKRGPKPKESGVHTKL